MNAPKLPLPNPEQWTTIAGAAALLAVSRRTIERMIDDGRMTGYRFWATSHDSSRHLWVPQVVELHEARQRAGIR